MQDLCTFLFSRFVYVAIALFSSTQAFAGPDDPLDPANPFEFKNMGEIQTYIENNSLDYISSQKVWIKLAMLLTSLEQKLMSDKPTSNQQQLHSFGELVAGLQIASEIKKMGFIDSTITPQNSMRLL